MEKHKLRSRWCHMLSRCEDDSYPQYMNYGGRGIYVCHEWHDFSTFYNWCIANNISATNQVDRIDNDGPYSPENCRISTRSENARNKSNNVILTAFGDSKTMVEWSEDTRCTVHYETLARRVRTGWSHEDAISTPDQRTEEPHNIKRIEAFGQSLTLDEWSRDARCSVSRSTLWSRLNSGWKPEIAISKDNGYNAGLKYEGKSILQWSKDPRCKVSYNTLARRLKSGTSPVDAMKAKV